MDALPELIYLVLRWRFSLSVIAAIGVALLLSNALVSFTAGYCISLVLFGVAFGVIWQGRASAGLSLTAPVPPTSISKPVAFLSFVLVGFFWGGIAAYLVGSSVGGALFSLAIVGLVGLWYRFLLRRHVSPWYLAFAAASLLAGYAALLGLRYANAL